MNHRPIQLHSCAVSCCLRSCHYFVLPFQPIPNPRWLLLILYAVTIWPLWFGEQKWLADSAYRDFHSISCNFADFYQCGPAPLEAIRRGEIGLGYDVAFVFAEVNADLCHFMEDPKSSWGFTKGYPSLQLY